MIYGAGSVIMSLLCDHGGKQGNKDLHGGEWSGVRSD